MMKLLHNKKNLMLACKGVFVFSLYFFIIIYFIYEVIGNLININIIKKMLDTYVQRASICAYTSFE
jgi:hypothetical protein